MPRIDWLHLALLVLWAFTMWRNLKLRRELREERDNNSRLRNLVREMQCERRR